MEGKKRETINWWLPARVGRARRPKRGGDPARERGGETGTGTQVLKHGRVLRRVHGEIKLLPARHANPRLLREEFQLELRLFPQDRSVPVTPLHKVDYLPQDGCFPEHEMFMQHLPGYFRFAHAEAETGSGQHNSFLISLPAGWWRREKEGEYRPIPSRSSSLPDSTAIS